VDLHAGIPSSLNEADFIHNPEKAGGSWGNIKGFEEYLKVLGGLKLESDLGDRWQNRLILHGSINDSYERRPFNILDEQSSNLGIREFLEYNMQKIKVGAGMEYFHEFFDWKTYLTLPEGQGSLLSDQGERRMYLNSFAYAQWRPAPFILVDAGLNLNLLSYSLTTRYRIDSTEQTGSYRYDPVWSPRIGISLRHGKRIWTYASAGHGFSAPSLEETLLPEGLVNTSLRPESGWNLDVGNRGSLLEGRMSYDLSLYSIFLDDLLVTERVAEDIFTGVNAGSAWNRGLELMLEGRLIPDDDTSPYNAELGLSYHLSRNTFTDFVDEGVDYSGKELPGIPRQILRARISAQIRGLSLEFQHVYTGRQWMDDGNEDMYGGYHLDHLQLSWTRRVATSPFHMMLYGGIRNLFDTPYASMILINAPSFGGQPPRYYYPGTPRYFYMGLRFAFTSAKD
jgi:iron complex outermembrane receptor protein